MIGRFPYQKQAKYPHMKPEDIKVWELFIDNNPRMFDSCDYDVVCGKGEPQDPNLPENIQKDGTKLTQKKIDVVAYIEDMVYIIEVKPIADMKAFGQMLTYSVLYKIDHPEAKLVFKMIICNAVERELQQIIADHDILIETV